MHSLANVAVHESQFPDRVRRELLEGLRSRRLNPKFHYDSIRQAQQWLALHEAFSPAAKDPGCWEIYEQLFKAAASRAVSSRVHVIGLGCGGGQKDVRLMEHLHTAGKQVFYTPVDVSLPMVLKARIAADKFVAGEHCLPVVCDLAAVHDLAELFTRRLPEGMATIITFFGLLPSLEPGQVVPQLPSLLSPGDSLLVSANLAPGPDYAGSMRRILPQYENDLTRDWLLTLLFDLGLSSADGRLQFGIKEHPPGSGMLRVEAHFFFSRDTKVCLENESVPFCAGEKLQAFFSYRYTPSLLERLLRGYGLEIANTWMTASEEEGVALAGLPC